MIPSCYLLLSDEEHHFCFSVPFCPSVIILMEMWMKQGLWLSIFHVHVVVSDFKWDKLNRFNFTDGKVNKVHAVFSFSMFAKTHLYSEWQNFITFLIKKNPA